MQVRISSAPLPPPSMMRFKPPPEDDFLGDPELVLYPDDDPANDKFFFGSDGESLEVTLL
jgi:hypothetical protein